MSSRDKSVATVVSFSAENSEAKRPAQTRTSTVIMDGRTHRLAGRFHQLRSGNRKSLCDELFDFAHLGSSESFHGRFIASLEHPAATDIDDLSRNIFGLFGSEEGHRGGNIFNRRWSANREARVANPAGLFQCQLVFINARGVYDVHRYAILGFFECQRT